MITLLVQRVGAAVTAVTAAHQDLPPGHLHRHPSNESESDGGGEMDGLG